MKIIITRNESGYIVEIHRGDDTIYRHYFLEERIEMLRWVESMLEEGTAKAGPIKEVEEWNHV